MGIKRKVTAERSNKKGRLRHPLLKLGSVHLQLYNYIKAHPHSYFRDTHHISTHPQPLADLVNEGLLRAHGKIPRSYTVVPENETARARDKVLVKIIIYANRYGEFSVKAELVGQKLTATEDFPQEVAFREITIPIPHPEDPYAIREIVDINPRVEDVYTTPDNDPLIVDAEFTIIPSEK